MDKVKYELEIPIHASPNMLYQYISSPSNLQEWFADQVDALTKDVSLIITDFADDEDEVEESKQLWENQIDELKQTIGA